MKHTIHSQLGRFQMLEDGTWEFRTLLFPRCKHDCSFVRLTCETCKTVVAHIPYNDSEPKHVAAAKQAIEIHTMAFGRSTG
jgi:hypothetical protein